MVSHQFIAKNEYFIAGMVNAIPGALASGTFAAVAGLSRLSIFGYAALGAAGTATVGLLHLDPQRGRDRWPLYFCRILILGYGFLMDLQRLIICLKFNIFRSRLGLKANASALHSHLIQLEETIHAT